jgi:hypothetical protein
MASLTLEEKELVSQSVALLSLLSNIRDKVASAEANTKSAMKKRIAGEMLDGLDVVTDAYSRIIILEVNEATQASSGGSQDSKSEPCRRRAGGYGCPSSGGIP